MSELSPMPSPSSLRLSGRQPSATARQAIHSPIVPATRPSQSRITATHSLGVPALAGRYQGGSQE